MNNDTFDRETLIEKALKIKALAERGETHESAAAKDALEKFLAKHGLSYEDLFDDALVTLTYRYRHDLERLLMIQVFYRLFRDKGRRIMRSEAKRAPKVLFLELTKAEHIDFQNYWYHYRDDMNKELSLVKDAFFYAYIYKNSLYDSSQDDSTESSEQGESSSDFSRKIYVASQLLETMTSTTPKRKLNKHIDNV